MENLDEEAALSIIFGNTKRKKRTENLIKVAESFEYLVGLYGSQHTVAEKVGLSAEMVREFRRILKLPDEVKALILDRTIDRLDVAYRISMLKDAKEQIQAAKTIANMPSVDIRDINRLIENMDLPIDEAKNIVLESKLKGLHIFMVDVDDEIYDEIVKYSKIAKTKPADLVKGIITDWVRSKAKAAGK